MSKWGSVRSTRIARTVWLALVVVGTVLYFAGPVSRWGTLQTACHPASSCLQFQLDRASFHLLAQYGVSPAAYAIVSLALLAAAWALWYGLSALIILRRPDDRGALLAAYFLAVFPIFEVSAWLASGALAGWIGNLFVPTLLIFALLFPDGRFAAPWTRWLAGLVIVFSVVTSIPFPSQLDGVELIATFGVFASVVGAQVYRYRSISAPSQRQQIKWALAGLAVAIFGIAALWYAVLVTPVATGNGSLYGAFSSSVGTAIIVSSIPVSITVAVLRNRLWDIDRIISRALAYTVLTLILAGAYIGSVIGLQALSRLITGQSSDIAIAVSTLAIAALFGPLRRRVQVNVDRRFYRSRYDAERILTGLGEHLRDQVDLAQLSGELTLAIQETLHPEYISLWIRDAGDAEQLSGTAGIPGC